MTVAEGEVAPSIKLQSRTDEEVSLDDLSGSWVVLYFYPRDNTPGCTTEACSFRDNMKRLESAGAVVVGVSPDTTESHRKFAGKYELPFTLLSDPDKAAANAYGVWKQKNMYGIKRMGIERSTFLIDPHGKVRRVWRKVKVAGHTDEVLAALQEEQKTG